MAIDFDALTSDINSQAVIPAGRYKATVKKAEMRNPKDVSRPPYLSIVWTVKDDEGNNLGDIFDAFTEPDPEKPLIQYKLRCLIEALGLKVTKFELRDLTKISVGKSCEIAIKLDESQETPRDVIDVFNKPPYKSVKKTKQKAEASSDEPEDESDEAY